jgi:hypothetical protein
VQRLKDGPESLSAANGRAAQKHGRTAAACDDGGAARVLWSEAALLAVAATLREADLGFRPVPKKLTIPTHLRLVIKNGETAYASKRLEPEGVGFSFRVDGFIGQFDRRTPSAGRCEL